MSAAGQCPAVGQRSAAQECHQRAAVGANELAVSPDPVGVGGLESDTGQVDPEPGAACGGEMVQKVGHSLCRCYRGPVERDRYIEGVNDGMAQCTGCTAARRLPRVQPRRSELVEQVGDGQ